MAKTERVEMRAAPEEAARINEAAKLAKSSVSAFILDAALAAADRMLARADVTLMPADQFDELMASIDVPDPAPNLARLAAKARKFRRS